MVIPTLIPLGHRTPDANREVNLTRASDDIQQEPRGTSTLECKLMFKVASWNLNSVRSRLTHVTAWLKVREPDVLLLQELKGTEFPSETLQSLGYESVAVTQKPITGLRFCRDIR